VSVCVCTPEFHRHTHANNETERQEGRERLSEKRIREPWSITCLPQSSPREGTPHFLVMERKGRGDGEGEAM